jgi:hypothetical protein
MSRADSGREFWGLPEEPKRQRISLPVEEEDSSDDELNEINEDEEWVSRYLIAVLMLGISHPWIITPTTRTGYPTRDQICRFFPQVPNQGKGYLEIRQCFHDCSNVRCFTLDLYRHDPTTTEVNSTYQAIRAGRQECRTMFQYVPLLVL